MTANRLVKNQPLKEAVLEALSVPPVAPGMVRPEDDSGFKGLGQ